MRTQHSTNNTPLSFFLLCMYAFFYLYPSFSHFLRLRNKIRMNKYYNNMRVAASSGEVKLTERNQRYYLPIFSFTVAPLSPLKMADYRLASLEGLNHVCSKKIDWPTATIHITENPISEAVVC